MPKEDTFEVVGHRYYANEFPSVDDIVMVKIFNITENGVYVELLEYNGIKGYIPASELSRRRIRSISKLVQVGKIEPSIVTRVDEEKGYVDLSKRDVNEYDVNKADRKFQEAKKVHNLAGMLSNRCGIPLDTVYEEIIWPLAEKYNSAYNAFMLSVNEPSVFDSIHIEEPVRKQLSELIASRMAPQAQKVRADIEITCFSIEGIDGIRAAVQAAEALSTKDMPIVINLIAPPLYVMTTTTIYEKEGIELLNKAIKELERVLKEKGGALSVKGEARVAHKQDEADLEGLMKKMELENQEVAADDDE